MYWREFSRVPLSREEEDSLGMKGLWGPFFLHYAFHQFSLYFFFGARGKMLRAAMPRHQGSSNRSGVDEYGDQRVTNRGLQRIRQSRHKLIEPPRLEIRYDIVLVLVFTTIFFYLFDELLSKPELDK